MSDPIKRDTPPASSTESAGRPTQERRSGAAPGSAPRTAANRTRLKRVTFRTVAACLPLVALALIELLLVLMGAGDNLHLVVKVPGEPRVLRYRLNAVAERPFFEQHDLAGPEPRRFDLPRPGGTYRIVVVGGSTVAGFPYPSALAFPRQMEVLLNAQSSDLRFEVLNAGITAVNSFTVADLVEQAIAAQPNLVVVHCGHNEFYGPGGAGSTVVVAPPSLFPLAVRLRRTRTYQLFTNLRPTERAAPSHLQETLPHTIEIGLHSRRFRSAESHFRANMQRIVHAADRAGIPVLLTTVACNLRHHSPVSFLVPEELPASQQQEWTAAFNLGQERAALRQWNQALQKLRQAAEISPESSLLHYRIGECLAGTGRHFDACEAFRRARDLDGCRFRAPSSFNEVIRELAASAAQADVFLADVESELMETTAPEIPGDNLFLEHVHYNLDGHRLVARILTRCIMNRVLRRSFNEAAVPADLELDRRLGLLQEDRISGQSYALQVLDVFPMNRTFDVALHRAAALGRIQREFDKLDPDSQQRFADLSLQDMADRLAEALADAYRRKGDSVRELALRRIAAIRRPWDDGVTFALARSLAESNPRSPEAVEICRALLAASPHHEPASRLLRTLLSK